MPRLKILHSVWTLAAAAAIAFQHVLLSYHVIRRKYRLYTVQDEAGEAAGEMPAPLWPEASPAAEAPAQPPSAARPRRRHHSGRLERASFEAYFREQKPWLSPDCKIAALVEAFDVNRTVLSAFINRTYGVNFNRYVNGWRLRELERLRALPANGGKSVRSLVEKAGFDNYRTYLRAMAAERQAAAENGEGTGKTETPDMAEGGGTMDIADTMEAVGITDKAVTADAAEIAGTTGIADTMEAAGITDKAMTADMAEIAGTTDIADIMDIMETRNTTQAAETTDVTDALTDAAVTAEEETGREKGGASW